jgi:predicted DNA binding CopG/RHH family protein
VKTVQNWNEIPDFDDESEEADFWAKHTLEPRLMNASLHRPSVRESTTITLRFDPQMLSRIKRIARARYLNYQSMMKQWLSERLESEVAQQSANSSIAGGNSNSGDGKGNS